MNHTNRIILCVILFVILFVILKYINSLQKKPIIKETKRMKKGLGQNNEFYYDEGGNDNSHSDSIQESTYTESNGLLDTTNML
jgi:hypothetical protein